MMIFNVETHGDIQRWSRVFEPGPGPQEKQVHYTDFCWLQNYFGKISKRDTLTFSRYRAIRQHIVKILLRRPAAGAELTVLLARAQRAKILSQNGRF